MRLSEILLTSKEIKRLIVKRSFELEIPLTHICSHLGISYVRLMKHYINGNSPEIMQMDSIQILRILELLGVKMKYQFIVDPDFNVEVSKAKIKQKKNKLLIDGKEEKHIASD